MSSYILIPYYNSIPKNSLSYFVILDNKLIITKNDILGNSSAFLSTSLNQLVYIFNGPNMGTFMINSLNSSTFDTYTLGITLNSIPPNLNDNTYCALSLVPSVYTIDRTFTNSLSNYDNGNFTLVDNNTILINKTSISSDDTLFIYILITNKSFNIINDISSAYYTISDVIISSNQENNKYITLDAIIPMMSLVDGSSYQFNISTLNATTLSDITINNTKIAPIKSASVNLIQTNRNTLKTPTYTPAKVSRVNIPTSLIDNSKNINLINNVLKKALDHNHNALITYKIDSFYGNGYFSVTDVDPNLIDLYTNVPNYPLREDFDDGFSLATKNGLSRIKGVINSTYNTIIQASAGVIQNQIEPDVITRIEIIFGKRYTLKISTVDSFKKQINFIKQHSLLFLSSGLNLYMISTNTLPINLRNGYDNIIQCNVYIDKPIPPESNNNSFVLSTAPIIPYVTFEYISTHIISNVIEKGCFNKLSVSSTNKLPTIIISNFETYFNYDVSAFNNLLYTIIQDSTQKLTPPYLNILNSSDYSVVCVLAILHVIPAVHQTTFTYSVISGASNFITLSNKTKYIFTLLSPNEFLSEHGILNITQKMKPELTNINNIIQNAKITIDKMVLNKPNEPDLIIAKTMITDTASQSTILSNMPITTSIVNLSASLLANVYNAIEYVLKVDNRNKDILLLQNTITEYNSPIITLVILKNISNYLSSAMSDKPNDHDIKLAHTYINKLIEQYTKQSIHTNKYQLNMLLTYIMTALNNNLLNSSLIKAKNLMDRLVDIPPETEKMTSSVYIEELDNVVHENNTNNEYYYIIMLILVIIILIYVIHSSSKMK